MTNKRMETKNRWTRIVRQLLRGECAHKVANLEHMTRSYIGQIARREAIPVCDHMKPGPDCVRTRM